MNLFTNSAKYFCAFFLLLFLSTFLFAQKEANIWYFGQNAGVDFNGPVSVALTDGLMNTNEGCASIADKNGNLLFYTDGSIIWNSIHDTMPNGKGLKGNFSSTQSAIIVPKPGSDSLYYVFTVDEEGGPDGLNYSEIDISLNGGLGDVTATKNVPLVAPTAEKITAVVHANGTDIWVITHEMGTDGFYAYLITPSGVNAVPTVSNIGTVVPLSPTNRSHGYLKTSPDGKHISMASEGINGELFDFDNSTGFVSNPIAIVPNGVYGTEFSPNSQLLYMIETGVLTQYDINASNIVASRMVIDSNIFSFIVSLQLGPDDKIYVARLGLPFLGVINNPNILGLGADFNPMGINLGTGICLAGLPSFIQSFFVDPKFSYINTCINQPTQFTNNTPSFDSLLWSFGDPASGNSDTSSETNPAHQFTDSGNFSVTLIAYNGVVSDTFSQVITIHPLPSSSDIINICMGDSTFIGGAFQTAGGMYFDSIIGGGNFGCDSIITTTLVINPDSDATINPVMPLCSNALPFNLTAANTGGIWSGIGITDTTNGLFIPSLVSLDSNIVIYNISGTCGDKDTITIIVNPLPVLTLCCDDTIQFGESVLLNAAGTPPFNWTPTTWLDIPNSSSPISTPDSTITYYMTQTSSEGCLTTDSITIYVINELLQIPNAFTPNNDGLNDEFMVFSNGLKSLEYFKIYNRWGQTVYFSKDLQAGWDGTYNGKIQEIGTYQYEFSAVNFEGNIITQNGTIALIR